MRKHFMAALAALILAAPIAANAQDNPSYAQPPSASNDQQLRGRIVSFDGTYNLQVRDDQGYLDNVQMHQGTIINPTGLTLASGMIVSIAGYADGSVFDANQIDTPYTAYEGTPYYGGHPWNYYGPTVSLGFFFGDSAWTRVGYGNGYPYGYGNSYYHGGGPRYGNSVNINVHTNSGYANGYNRGSYPQAVNRGSYSQGGNRGSYPQAGSRGSYPQGGNRGAAPQAANRGSGGHAAAASHSGGDNHR